MGLWYAGWIEKKQEEARRRYKDTVVTMSDGRTGSVRRGTDGQTERMCIAECAQTLPDFVFVCVCVCEQGECVCLLASVCVCEFFVCAYMCRADITHC